AEDGIRDFHVTGVQTCALPISGVVALLMLGIILALLWVAVMAWFILEVVRLGMKLMRTPGHARWVGVGALASSVVAFLFNLTGEIGRASRRERDKRDGVTGVAQ